MNDIKIASILIRKRREKGITQEELASCMGVSKAAVSKWEKEHPVALPNSGIVSESPHGCRIKRKSGRGCTGS